MSLAGKIAIVTGASRGIGRGIALQLGSAGALVYVTGRKPQESFGSKMEGLPLLEQTAQDISDRGGKGIHAYVDHSNMAEVKRFFEMVQKEHDGQLDILVNNAYSGVNSITDNLGKKFYECDPEMWDDINNVGLRNHYFCAVYAARMMAKKKDGLIVNISSAGGLQYVFNVPYGVGKQAVDRMGEDMAVELKPDNVTVITLWPGAVRTELMTKYFEKEGTIMGTATMTEAFLNGETTEYPGKAVVAIAQDPKKIKKTGKIHITADLGAEYGFKDIDGRDPPNLRSLSGCLKHLGWKRTSACIPGFIKLPGIVIWTATSRFDRYSII